MAGPVAKRHMRTLYVSRPLLNGRALAAWATRHGVPNVISAEEMHATIIYSRAQVDWDAISYADPDSYTAEGGPRFLKVLGPTESTLALRFVSDYFRFRHDEFREMGASWDWPEYLPHVTLSYDAAGFEFDALDGFTGALVFGPERFAEVKEDWEPKKS